MTNETFITLRINDRTFVTTVETLTRESPFFRNLFDTLGVSNVSDPYFLDTDPDLFVHILRYLRRGVYPLLYDQSHGFDYNTYHALEREADYFGIAKLSEWLRGGVYESGVVAMVNVAELGAGDIKAQNVGEELSAMGHVVLKEEGVVHSILRKHLVVHKERFMRGRKHARSGSGGGSGGGDSDDEGGYGRDRGSLEQFLHMLHSKGVDLRIDGKKLSH